MRKLAVANAVLVLAFAVPALFAPAAVFAPFGIGVDAATAGIVRGYAAALIGFGILLLGLRGTADPGLARLAVFAMLAFNALEVVLQLDLALNGLAGSAIWVTIAAHAALTAWAAALMLRGPAAP
jgi:hypothetical protein